MTDPSTRADGTVDQTIREAWHELLELDVRECTLRYGAVSGDER
jgi:hypothetical protein